MNGKRRQKHRRNKRKIMLFIATLIFLGAATIGIALYSIEFARKESTWKSPEELLVEWCPGSTFKPVIAEHPKIILLAQNWDGLPFLL